MKRLINRMANQIAAWATGRVITILVCLSGICIIGISVFGNHFSAATATLVIVGFAIGGVRISLATTDGEKNIEVETPATIGLGAAMVCGPIGATLPAAAAGIGEWLLVQGKRKPFRESVPKLTRLILLSTLAGATFQLAGGVISYPASIISLAAAIAAMLVYAVFTRLLSGAFAKGLWLALGAGYGLAGMVAALPAFAALVVALPLAIALLGMLKATPLKEESLSDDEQEADDSSEQKESVRHSFVDPLTGVASHRYLDMFLRHELSRAERFNQPLTVFIVDLDDFKELKEASGEDAANTCLSSIAESLKQMLRDYDLIARHKDDMFMVVLPETTIQAGYDTAWRLHSEISGKLLPLRATFSVGVATYPTYGETIDDLLASAHHALNRAKFSGKNTVVGCHTLAKAS